MNFLPFPDLHTARLNLRELTAGDGEAIAVLRSDATVNRFLDRPKTCSPAEAGNFIAIVRCNLQEGRSLYWVINAVGSDELIGTICLWNFSADETRAEIGYELLPAWQGKGLMQEAVQKVTRYAFAALQLGVIIAFSQTGNTRSSGLLTSGHFLKDESQQLSPGAPAGYDVFYLRKPA